MPDTRARVGLLVVLTLAAGPVRAAADAVIEPETWEVQTALPMALQHHRAVVAGGALHVIGGRDRFNKLQAAVYRAPLESNGTLGAWEREADLPVGVAQHGAVELNGAIYVAGGLKGVKQGELATDEVWRGVPDKKGVVRAWERAGRLPEAVAGHGMTAARGRLWVAGGLGPAGYRNAVWTAEPGEGRTAPAWTASMPLPVGIAYAALTSMDAHLVVVGGQTPGEGRTLVLPTVYVGPILENGVVPTWYLASSKLPGAWLSFGRNQANVVPWRSALFCFGGQDALWFLLDTVASASFDAKRGDLGGWGVVQGAAEMPQLTAAAGWKDFIYLAGGTVKGAVSARVLRGTCTMRDRDE